MKKTVTVKGAKRARYLEVAKVNDAVKGAGANPVVLVMNDLNDSWESFL